MFLLVLYLKKSCELLYKKKEYVLEFIVGFKLSNLHFSLNNYKLINLRQV